MTDERSLDRLITRLRGQVAELRRLEREGATQEALANRRYLIMRLQEGLANSVRDLLGPPRPSAT